MFRVFLCTSIPRSLPVWIRLRKQGRGSLADDAPADCRERTQEAYILATRQFLAHLPSRLIYAW